MVVALMPHLGLQKEPFHAWNARRLSLDPSGPGEAQEKQVFSIKQRKKTHANRWGKSWILLPNAMYGSWERALFPGLTKDEEILLRKRQQIKGFRPR